MTQRSPEVVRQAHPNAPTPGAPTGEAGMGQAVLPFLAVDTNDRGVVVSSLDPPIPPRVISLARRRGRTLAPAADRFIELAADVCASLRQSERLLVDGVVG